MTSEIEQFQARCEREFKRFIQLFAAAMLVLVINFLLPAQLDAVGGYVFFFECLAWCAAALIIKQKTVSSKGMQP